ncbi:sulfite exporter TauE/SafE family protein [Trinickia terrae]|uniref:Probable membrane transporter protein n=1 Tax=Trinickia terrae TaxID=2571161 RepID=A0A4U1IAB8_9BURK|nr:sulfite exporter TauE/SafE family protein [Trinickia terrae]TKC90295.1 sulfite exporter TauE/SafE family protein [Trinickia terrae]
MLHLNLSTGILSPSLQALGAQALLGVIVALVLGGMVKGVVSIGVPLVAMPILSQFLPIKDAVLLLSMPIILGNIPQALEGGETVATARRIVAPLIGTVLGNLVGVTMLVSLAPHRAQAIAGVLLMVAALLLLASPRLALAPRWAKPAGFAIGFAAAVMESIASVPGPLLAMYLIATGATGRVFTKQIAIILVVSIVTLVVAFGGGLHASWVDVAISALASVPVIAGIVLARPLRDRLPPAAFRSVVLLFVLAAAVQMIWKSGVLR